MNRIKYSLAIVFVLVCFLGHGQTVPGTLSYQGILMESDGITPLADGSHNIEFKFYTAASGGTLLETRTISVTTIKGLYTCVIGDGAAGNAALPASLGTQQVFIAIKVDSGAELTPRAQLTTNAYAFQAQSAYSISDGAVGTNKIVDGAVANSKIATDAVTTGKISDGTIENVDISATAAIAGSKVVPAFGGQNISTTGTISSGAITATSLSGALNATNLTGTIDNLRLDPDLQDLADGSLSGGRIDNDAISASKLQDDPSIDANRAVTTDHIRDAAITNAKLATGIDASKITSGILPNSIFPTGSIGNLAFWGTANSFGNDPGLYWDNANITSTSGKGLGLGTTSPKARLHLVSDGNTDQTDDIIIEQSSGSLNGGSLRFHRARGATGASSTVAANDVMGRIYFAGHNGSIFSNAARIDANIEAVSGSNLSGNLVFNTATNSTSVSEKMRIAASGNIGIGTGGVSPGSLLHLDRSGIGNYIRFTEAGTLRGLIGISGTTNDLIGTDADNDLSIRSESNMLFGIGASEKMRISSAGNVGIGTSSPSQKLHVVGGISVNGSILSTSGNDLYLTSGIAGQAIVIEPNGAGSTIGRAVFGADGVHYFRNSSGANQVLFNNGHIEFRGTNTTNPVLRIFQADEQFGIRLYEPGASSYWDISDYNSNNLHFRSNGNDRAYVDDADGSWDQVSDVRLKENITDLPNLLVKILQLRPKTYNFISDKNKERKFGLIAQEVEPLFPEFVDKESNGYSSLAYHNFGIISIKGIQELYDLIQNQQSKIDSLKSINKTLEDRLAAIEAKLFPKGTEVNQTNSKSDKP